MRRLEAAHMCQLAIGALMKQANKNKRSLKMWTDQDQQELEELNAIHNS